MNITDIQNKFEGLIKNSPEMSGKMVAILGWIVGADFTNPAIQAIVRTSDDMILAQDSGDIGCNSFFGHWSDFQRNVQNCCRCAKLTLEETKWVAKKILSIGSTC
jgi:hypothetical protein